jgi:hypothetical protein
MRFEGVGVQDVVELFLAEPGVLGEKPLEIRAEVGLLGPLRQHMETSRFAIELERAIEETPQTPQRSELMSSKPPQGEDSIAFMRKSRAMSQWRRTVRSATPRSLAISTKLMPPKKCHSTSWARSASQA